MKLYIYSLEKTLFEGDGDVISLPTTEGEISVLNNHIPLVTPLGKGKIKIRAGSGFDEEKREFEVVKGFVQINPHEAILIV
ncbi:MAG: hypothetical protein A2939_00035 [Parcubacteria group bacterium RIFCSPLOWO2_01_FULL_48_18]|nr:MAG: hypothetical protein A2939_00035 [Parcubacteria group bacterium RIFCSPLOWO2_01_FULL_48_18]